MNKTATYKMALDSAMLVLLPLLMAYSLVGETAHEWLGAFMCLMFVGHHILNRRWYPALAKGRWTAGRILQTAVNTALMACMLTLMVSGIILSRHVFSFLPISGGQSFGRIAHMLGAYWGFCLMSLHLGLHWNMVLGMCRRLWGTPSKVQMICMRGVAFVIACYGFFAFFKRWIPDYLFLRSHFVFFDFDEPLAFFLLDYLAIMGAFTWLGYYLSALLRRRNNSQRT